MDARETIDGDRRSGLAGPMSVSIRRPASLCAAPGDSRASVTTVNFGRFVAAVGREHLRCMEICLRRSRTARTCRLLAARGEV